MFRLILMLLLVGAALAGCASRPKALSVSITELGTESRMDAGSWTGELRHRQSYNIAGTGAIDMIGMMSSDPDPSPLPDMWKSWFRQELLPDQLALRLTPGCSRVYIRDFQAADQVPTARDVVDVRDGLQNVQAKVVELVGAETNLQLLGMLASTRSQIEGAEPGNDKKKLEQHRDALNEWLSGAGYEGIGQQNDLSDITRAATVRAAKLKDDLAQAELDFAKVRSKPGIIVARWKISASSDTRADAAGAGFERSSQEDGSGFVVLGAPRVATLAAGDDLVIRACSLAGATCRNRPNEAPGRLGVETMVPPHRLYVTTYQLLAKHAAWTDARSVRRIQSLAINLNKLIESLTAIQASPVLITRLKSLQINLVRTTASALDAENMGALSAGRLKTIEFSFGSEAVLRQSVERIATENQDYLVISSMRSTLDGHVRRGSGAGTTWPADTSCANPSWARKPENPNTAQASQ